MDTRIALKHFNLSFIPIFIGGSIYALFRPLYLKGFHLLKGLGLQPITLELRTLASPIHDYLPEWAVYSLPDALWTFSFISFFGILWWPQNKLIGAIIIGCITSVSLGSEILQWAGILSGTFDVIDLYFKAGFALLSITIIALTSKQKML